MACVNKEFNKKLMDSGHQGSEIDVFNKGINEKLIDSSVELVSDWFHN